MFQLLLAIIYLAFISLGLPDALLGSAWPTMYQELSVPVSFAGGISMIIAAGTIISSLQSDRLTRRFGTGKVTAFSVLMTAAALFGFSVSHSYAALCLWASSYLVLRRGLSEDAAAGIRGDRQSYQHSSSASVSAADPGAHDICT